MTDLNYREVLAEIATRQQDSTMPEAYFDILELVLEGKKYSEIAEELNLTESTIKTYAQSLWTVLADVLGTKVTRFNVGGLLLAYAEAQRPATTGARKTTIPGNAPPLEMVPMPPQFIGRVPEQAELLDLLRQPGITVLLGQPGIGKTALAAKTLPQVFSGAQIIWQTIDAQSSIAKIVEALGIDPAAMTENQWVDAVVEQLRSGKFALVLDQAEELLDAGKSAFEVSLYRSVHRVYGQLLKQLAGHVLQSSVLILTQQPFPDLERYQRKGLPVHSLQLTGLVTEDVRALVHSYDLGDKGYKRLASLYQGHPGCLMAALPQVADLYNGDIDEFLKATMFVETDTKIAYEVSFDRLSAIEQSVLNTLASGTLTFLEIVKKFDKLEVKIARSDLIEALNRLEQMNMIEKTGQPAKFSIHPIVKKTLVQK
jgi:hypothetical protein